jgi:hypothetical protein
MSFSRDPSQDLYQMASFGRYFLAMNAKAPARSDNEKKKMGYS